MVATGFEQDFYAQPLIKQLIQNYDAPITNVITLYSEKLNQYKSICRSTLQNSKLGPLR